MKTSFFRLLLASSFLVTPFMVYATDKSAYSLEENTFPTPNPALEGELADALANNLHAKADYLRAQRHAEQHQFEAMYKLVIASAKNGYAPAQYMYYRMLFAGAGVDRDYRRAYDWLTKAANNDDALAQFVLGGYLDPNRDGEMDTRRAYELEKRRLFIREVGISKNAELAQMWFTRSADRGNVESNR